MTHHSRPFLRQLDLLALTGYKYVFLVLNCIAGLALGRTAYYVSFFYTAAAMTFFFFHSLKPAVSLVEAMPGQVDAGKNSTLVLVAAGLQIILLWWLGLAP